MAEEIKTRKLPTGTAVEKIRPIIAEGVQALQGVTKELEIKEIVTKVMLKIEACIASQRTLSRHRSDFRTAIKDAFPNIQTSIPNSEIKPDGYYFTEAGKEEGSRYEHLALWYATTNKTRWSVVGDVARELYFRDLPPLENQQPAKQPTEQPAEQPTEEPATQPAEEPATQLFTFETMTLEQLELPSDMQATVSAALTHSGLSLPEFLKQAAKVYANTLVGRSSQATHDLSAVPTEKLKTEKEYKTHPARPAEMVKRAIKAIKLHNDACTTLKEKWNITQSLLVELSGSRPGTVKEFVEGQFAVVVKDYNAATFSELNESELRCWNRKDKAIPKPDLAALVPDGMDI